MSALHARLVQECLLSVQRIGVQRSLRRLCEHLRNNSVVDWLACGIALLEANQAQLAAALLDEGLVHHPDYLQGRYWLSRALWQTGEVARTEVELRKVLAVQADTEVSQLLAHVMRSQGKLNAAAEIVVESAGQGAIDTDGALQSAQFLRECRRQDLAAVVCEREFTKGNRDSRLYALAGNIEQELGHFDHARLHYRGALQRNVDLNTWFVLSSLASIQNYKDRQHPDFALLRSRSLDDSLTPRARAAILFALGKACDDVSDYVEAAQSWREANRLRFGVPPWARSDWESFVAAREAAIQLPVMQANEHEPVPIFVVGLPRSGTTLVAELLGRHPGVRNRGELPLLEYIARQLVGLGENQLPTALKEASSVYMAHLCQDDAPSHFYVDKNPLNFRYLDHVAAMFPSARVIHCRRGARDTALSIWGQSFASEDYSFAYNLEDIASLSTGCQKLMAHWKRVLQIPVITVDYEDVVRDPEAALNGLLSSLGLSPFDDVDEHAGMRGVITSASQWQARQPVHDRSVGRWRNYARHIPQIEHLFPG